MPIKSIQYNFKMNIQLNALWQTILQNYIVHAKQSKITHIEMSLKQNIYPNTRRGGVLSVVVTV